MERGVGNVETNDIIFVEEVGAGGRKTQISDKWLTVDDGLSKSSKNNAAVAERAGEGWVDDGKTTAAPQWATEHKQLWGSVDEDQWRKQYQKDRLMQFLKM